MTPWFRVSGLSMTANNTDSVGEVHIVTSGAKAEYGRNAGGQVELITRSGTNSFHGNLFDYLRNNDLNANSFFNNAAIPGVPGSEIHPEPLRWVRWRTGEEGQAFLLLQLPGQPDLPGRYAQPHGPHSHAKRGIFTWKTPAGVLSTYEHRGQRSAPHRHRQADGENLRGAARSNNLNAGDTLNTAGYLFNNPNGSWNNSSPARPTTTPPRRFTCSSGIAGSAPIRSTA